MIKHYPAIGLYDSSDNHYYIAFVMDDFGNLVGISDEHFDQAIYFRTGKMF